MNEGKQWLICVVVIFLLFVAIPILPPVAYLFTALIAVAVGRAASRSGATTPARPLIQPAYSAPVQPITTTRVELPERKMPDNIPADLKCPSCGANIKPTDKRCGYCGSSLQPLLELPEPAKLRELAVGNAVRVTQPQKGALDYKVQARLLFTELWQASRGPDVPWTPTGNYFAGFTLEPAAYLLNWQDRFYLLDQRRSLTDMDINSNFAGPARQFAQSNQTAEVEFLFDGLRWRMVDIGRFAIEFEDGEGAHLHKGAIGRFIHASSGGQALVIDDFQSGGSGGQDTLWRGFQIKETDITF